MQTASPGRSSRSSATRHSSGEVNEWSSSASLARETSCPRIPDPVLVPQPGCGPLARSEGVAPTGVSARVHVEASAFDLGLIYSDAWVVQAYAAACHVLTAHVVGRQSRMTRA